MEISAFWFRRDLRLTDNTALHHALESGLPVLAVFVFDDCILDELPPDDPRVNFIYDELEKINQTLLKAGSSLLIKKGNPVRVWEEILAEHLVKNLYFNKDYEPYAVKRDQTITENLGKKGVQVYSFKDQVIHEPGQVLKKDGMPYTVYTPYKNCWLNEYQPSKLLPPPALIKMHQQALDFATKAHLGIKPSSIKVQDYSLEVVSNYGQKRDFPALDATSYLGPHLRFGTVSVRQIIAALPAAHEVFLSELIWREFFMQILFHFPKVVGRNFRAKYDGIQWLNEASDFERWTQGQTGYPMVDAGMRQLNATGYMHNRVRMITAGFLCKHLLINWQWGEAYFAKKLLDYELASNNGNWQWAAGTGCDAAPYFRIFNPESQFKKFDSASQYVKKWVPEWGTSQYPTPMVVHDFARKRALEQYKKGMVE